MMRDRKRHVTAVKKDRRANLSQSLALVCCAATSAAKKEKSAVMTVALMRKLIPTIVVVVAQFALKVRTARMAAAFQANVIRRCAQVDRFVAAEVIAVSCITHAALAPVLPRAGVVQAGTRAADLRIAARLGLRVT